MPSPLQFHVFLSAVSSEFRNERVQLENWLERKGLHVSSQEKFNQGDSTLWQKLHDEVARCQTVICVIGAEPGWPSGGELPEGAPERSWTQWEFWLAWGEKPWSPRRRDKVYVFFPSDLDRRIEKARTAASGDRNRLLALDLQQAHIDRVKQTNKHYSTFTDSDDLIKQCLVLDLPTIPRTRPNNLPYDTLGSLFKGRDETLENLHRQLTRCSNQAVGSARQVIHGQGGVGKTRFAIEYALRHTAEYQALLFLMAEKPESLRQNLAALCGPLVLNLPEQDAKEEETRINAALRWLQDHQDWLLIIDNVDTPEAAEKVEQLVGRLTGGTILVTSRLTDWSGAIVACELDALPVEVAAAFLLERTNERRRRLPDDEEKAEALAQELGGLALAMEQAGAFIAKKRSSLSEYLERWREQDRVVREWFDERLMKYPRSIMTTWETTILQLSTQSQALLDALSWLAPDPIPRTLLSERDMQDDLAELAGFSLAKIEEDGSRFRIHRLVQDVTREQQGADDKALSLLLAQFMIKAAAVGNPEDVRSWPILEPFRSHIAAVTAYTGRYGDPHLHTDLMTRLALLLFAKATYDEAEPLMRRVLVIDEASYGPEHPKVAIALNNLAQLLAATNRLWAAEPLIRRALAINEASYGPDHPEVAIALNNLAAHLLKINRLAEAEPLMRRTLAINEASYGPDHPKIAIALNNLAQLLKDTNRLVEAEPMMRRALAIDEASYGPEHPDVARGLNNLALLLQETNRLRKAEPLMRRALTIHEASYGPDHPYVACGLNNLAQLLMATNRLQQAEPLMRRALAIDEAIDEASYGPEHPDVARDLNNLAQLLHDTNRLHEAEPLMKRALAIDEASYGPEHPEVSVDLNNLAQLLEATNRLQEAEPLMRRVLCILLVNSSHGHLHPKLKHAFSHYTTLLQASGLSSQELVRRMRSFGDEAGLDATTYQRLIAKLFS